MAYNAILARQLVSYVVFASGRLVEVSVATQTSAFNRPDFAAANQGVELLKAVDEHKHSLPEGTVAVCGTYVNDQNLT